MRDVLGLYQRVLAVRDVLGLYQRVLAVHQRVLGVYQRVLAVHPCAWLVPACVCRAPACACHRCFKANSSICAMRPPCYYVLEEMVNMWKFSVEGLQSCGPCGAAGHP